PQRAPRPGAPPLHPRPLQLRLHPGRAQQHRRLHPLALGPRVTLPLSAAGGVPTETSGFGGVPRAREDSPVTLLRQALLVAGKDLRIEVRSRVALNQVLPFAGVVLLLFPFALDPDRGLLHTLTTGLFWVAVLLAGLLALSRAFAVE